MGSSKRGHGCGCGLGSKIPLRGQLIILLAVGVLLFIVVVPFIIDRIRASLVKSFEADIAYTNINRFMGSLDKALQHEDNVLKSYTVWNDTADAMDALHDGDVETFEQYLDDAIFDFGHWSDWSCGNLLVFYSQPEDDNEMPKILWSEFHETDHDTLEMDINNTSPVPAVFNSSDFIKNNVNQLSTSGFIATESCVLLFSCQLVFDSDLISSHGTMCRATDIVLSLDGISSSAGACVSIYNMADNDDIPDEFREKFEALKVGERTNDNKFDGDYTLQVMKNGQWNSSMLSLRVCGPAEQANANITLRSLSYLHMANAGKLIIKGDEKNNGLGIILDNARELEPILVTNFGTINVNLMVFGVILFLAFGLITECCVIRKLDTIAKAAYEALVEGEEEYDDYYTGSKNSHKSEKQHRDRGKNELITMATLAAETVEKNRIEYERKQNLLVVEKMQSSLAADQLRILELFCDRHGDDVITTLFKSKKKKKARAANSRRSSTSSTSSMFSASTLDLGTNENITLDRILNDPFSLEIFKNFSVQDPNTHKFSFPARRNLLFLLSTLFYRSMADVACTDARVECVKGIIGEFFGVEASIGSKRMTAIKNDDLGISDAARKTLLANAANCIASRRPTKSLFDDSSSVVRENLERTVFPLFRKSPEFSLVTLVLSHKALIQKKSDEVKQTTQDEANNNVEKEKILREYLNVSGGSNLSLGSLKHFAGF